MFNLYVLHNECILVCKYFDPYLSMIWCCLTFTPSSFLSQRFMLSGSCVIKVTDLFRFVMVLKKDCFVYIIHHLIIKKVREVDGSILRGLCVCRNENEICLKFKWVVGDSISIWTHKYWYTFLLFVICVCWGGCYPHRLHQSCTNIGTKT